MTPPIEQTTSDGYDMQFGTNVLGKHTIIPLQLDPYQLLSCRTLVLCQVTLTCSFTRERDISRSACTDHHHVVLCGLLHYTALGHVQGRTCQEGPRDADVVFTE